MKWYEAFVLALIGAGLLYIAYLGYLDMYWRSL